MADVGVGRLIAVLGLDKKQFDAQLKGVERQVRQVASTVARQVSTIASVATGVGAGLLARGMIRETIEAERVTRQLAQAITTTGRAGRVSVAEVDRFAQSIQRTTTFSDEAVKSLVSMLLPFRNIGEDVVPRASKAILDFAAFTGKGAVESARLFGRALNDPVKGMSALGRAGVSLNAGTRETIKALAEQGRVAEAQSLLLGELEKSYGGAAAAARDSLGGALEALRNRAGDLLESDSLPGVRKEIESLISALDSPEVQRSVDQLASAVTVAFRAIAESAAFAVEHTTALKIALGALAGFRFGGVPGAVAGGLAAAILGKEPEALQAAVTGAADAIDGLERAQGAAIPTAKAAAEAQLAFARSTIAATEAAFKKREAEGLPAFIGTEDAGSKLNFLRGQVNVLEAQLAALGDTGQGAFDKTGESAEGAAGGVDVLTKAAQRAAKAAAEAQASIAAQITATKQQIALGNLDARTRAQITAVIEAQNAAIKGGTLLTREQEQAIFDLNGALSDQELALKAVAAAEKADADVAAEMLRERERQSEATQRILERPFLNAIDSVQDATSDMFEEILSGGIKSFKSLAKNVLSIMKTLAAQVATTLLFKPVLASLTGSGGGGGTGLVGGIVDAIKGALGFGGQATNTLAANAVGQSGALNEGEFSGFLGKIGSAIGAIGGFFGDATFGTGLPISNASIVKFGKAAAGALAGIAAGIPLGLSFAPNNVNSPLAQSINPIYNKVGSIVGSVVGSVVGSFFGSGAAGGALGGLFGGIQGKDLGLLQQNASNQEKWVNGMLSIGGGALALLVKKLAFGVPTSEATLSTRASAEGTVFQHGAFAQGPFGVVGLTKPGTNDIAAKQAQTLADFFVAFDKQLFRILTDRQRVLVTEALQGSNFHEEGVVIDNELVKILKNRFAASFSGLFESEAVNDFLGALPKKLKEIDKVVEGLLGFIQERAAIIQEIDDLIGDVNLSAAAKSLKDLGRHFEDLAERARVLGFNTAELARLELARVAAIAKLKDGFSQGIEDSILGILNPSALASRELERQQAERLANAIDFEADLTRVAYLGQLEREKLAREANKPITDLLTQLTTTLGNQLAPTQLLAAAEARFNEQVAIVQGGDRSRLDEVAEAARNLLAVSLSVFASTEQFFQRREFVLRQLENIAGPTLPGFATGGGFTVPGNGRDNVVPLFRVSGGERVSVATRGQQGEQAAGIASLREALEDANAQRESGNALIARNLKDLREAVDRQQSALTRVAYGGARRRR